MDGYTRKHQQSHHDDTGNFFVKMFTNLVQSAYVPGPIQVVVAQSVIVVNMLMAFFYTGARYNALHYGGVLSVIIGIIIGVFPFFENGLSMITNDNIWIWISK